MNSLESRLEDQLKDIYNAEQQLTKALPRMARGASTPELKEALESHLAETEGHIERLDQVGEHLELSLRGKKCKAVEGLIEEGKEALEEEGSEAVLDAAIIAAAQKVEHYEISAYGSARALAERLGMPEVARLLQANLDEESAADEKLTDISERIVLPAGEALHEEDVDEVAVQRKAPRTRSRAGGGRRSS
jgi:ferritin-like metal-binding protein YciE